MFTANFVHVYREFRSCLPRNLFMFTANFVHVYRKFCSCLPRILFMFTANLIHFGRRIPAQLAAARHQLARYKTIFRGRGLLRSVGGDLGGDGKWVDASRRNWKAPDNKLPRILFMFTAKFVHVYRNFFYRKISSCLPGILFMFTAKKNVLYGPTRIEDAVAVDARKSHCLCRSTCYCQWYAVLQFSCIWVILASGRRADRDWNCSNTVARNKTNRQVK